MLDIPGGFGKVPAGSAWIEENGAAVSLKISADTEDALLQVFAPGAASGLRYPENHLRRLGI